MRLFLLIQRGLLFGQPFDGLALFPKVSWFGSHCIGRRRSEVLSPSKGRGKQTRRESSSLLLNLASLTDCCVALFALHSPCLICPNEGVSLCGADSPVFALVESGLPDGQAGQCLALLPEIKAWKPGLSLEGSSLVGPPPAKKGCGCAHTRDEGT